MLKEKGISSPPHRCEVSIELNILPSNLRRFITHVPAGRALLQIDPIRQPSEAPRMSRNPAFPSRARYPSTGILALNHYAGIPISGRGGTRACGCHEEKPVQHARSFGQIVLADKVRRTVTECFSLTFGDTEPETKMKGTSGKRWRARTRADTVSEPRQFESERMRSKPPLLNRRLERRLRAYPAHGARNIVLR